MTMIDFLSASKFDYSSFKKNSSLRGTTFEEKKNSLIQKWEKIIDDCESDLSKSLYRADYAQTHKNVLNGVIKFHSDKELLLLDIKYFIEKSNIVVDKEVLTPGQFDATIYIVLELNDMLDAKDL